MTSKSATEVFDDWNESPATLAAACLELENLSDGVPLPVGGAFSGLRSQLQSWLGPLEPVMIHKLAAELVNRAARRYVIKNYAH